MIIVGQFWNFVPLCRVARVERFRTPEIVVLRCWASAGPASDAPSVQTGLDKRADALDGAFEILRSYVRHVADQERQTLARFDKSQRIVSQLLNFKILTSPPITSFSNLPIYGRERYCIHVQVLVCLSNVQSPPDGRQISNLRRRPERSVPDWIRERPTLRVPKPIG